MFRTALKILIKDKAKYLGLILGLSFASFIITQQAGIFVGIMSRTYGFISDTSQGDIWVMDMGVQYIDDIKPLKDTDLDKVRGVDGVEWASPLYKGMVKAKLPNGKIENSILIGIDEATFIGAPPKMSKENVEKLKFIDGIMVNKIGASEKLATKINNQKIPLQVNDVIEINDLRAQVVGTFEARKTFHSEPLIYTTYNRAINFGTEERKMLSYILVKAQKDIKIPKLCNNIEKFTKLKALTNEQFENLTVNYYLKYTGIPLNFGIAVLLGFIIGAAIAGQTFYNFILDNSRYLAVLKAMGAKNNILIKMTLLQVFWVGIIGWSIGTGAASFFGFLLRNTDLSFKLPWQLYLFTISSVFFICLISSFLSLKKVMKIEPAIVFKT